MGVYNKGLVDEKRIREKIIRQLLEKEVKFPVAIYSYYSKYSASKTGVDLINTKGGPRFKPKRPKSGSKSYDWVIDKELNIYRVRDFKIVEKIDDKLNLNDE